jgi:hypothetical protein
LTPRPVLSLGEEWPPGRLAAFAVMAHMAMWWLVPVLLLGNLHTDSTEMAYWGFDPRWTYPKHPPLGSFLAANAISLFGHPFAVLVAIGQACVGIAAVYVWATLTRLASDRVALFGVLLLIASPSATIFAFQVNHNTLLMPFVAALLHHALLYAEKGRLRDAIVAGMALGLGMLTKYAIAIVPLAIVAAALFRPSLRRRLFAWPVLVGGIVATLILAPHVAALLTENAGALSRATKGSSLTSIGDVFESLGDFITATALMLLIPGAVLYRRCRQRLWHFAKPSNDNEWIAAAATMGSLAIMVLAAFATGQLIKPLWSVGFMPASAIWAGLIAARIEEDPPASGPAPNRARTKVAVMASGALLCSFLLYLAGGVAIGQPRWAWMADAKALSEEISDTWPAERGPLPSVMMDRRGIVGLAALMQADQPRIVEFGVEAEGAVTISAWTDAERLAKVGGVAFLFNEADLTRPIAGLCAERVRTVAIRSVWGSTTTPVRLALMTPANGAPKCKPVSEPL